MKRTNKESKTIGLLGLFALVITAHGATNVIDFEQPLPGGLVAINFVQGTYVLPQSVISTQYVALGVIMQGTALIKAGFGHAASGTNQIGGINTQSPYVDYGAVLTFTFVSPTDGITPATTDYFSLTPDRGRDSDNTALFSAYSLDGRLQGSVTYDEAVKYPGPSRPIVLNGLGRFHKVFVSPTLHVECCGGIGFDLLSFSTVEVQPRLAIRCSQVDQHCCSQVEISWDSVANASYQMQYCFAPRTNEWADLGSPIQGNGSMIRVIDAVAPERAQTFYRIVTLP